MKKKNIVLSLLLAASAVSIASCAGGEGGPKEYPYEEDTSVKTASVHLGLFETKAYTPMEGVEFSVTIADMSLVSYVDGAFVTEMKEGKTTASFRSSSVNYDVTVTVEKDKTVPAFGLETEELSIYKGVTYRLGTSMFYRGLDMGDQEYEIRAYAETESGTSKVEVSGHSLLVTAKEIGTDTYTVCTDFIGFTLSKTLKVSVKDNNGLVICGRNLIYDNNGPHYSISMYRYSENPIDLKEDIAVLKGGIEVPFENLSIAFDDTSVLGLKGNCLDPKKTGKTFFTVSTGGVSIRVDAEVYKPVLNDFEFTVQNNRFNLDMDLQVNEDKSRTYTPNAESKLPIALPSSSGTRYESVSKVLVKGQEIASSGYSFDADARTLTLNASAFTIEDYGKQSVTIYADAAEYTDAFTCTIDFVTKYLTEYRDLITYFTHLTVKDTIVGEYVLKNDLDGNGGYATGAYCNIGGTPNYSTGFRGILDGDGHAIKNFKTTMFGFFLIIGTGSAFKNISFEDIHYKDGLDDLGRGEAFLGRFINGATFDDVSVRLASDSSTGDPAAVGGKTNSVGLFSTEVFNWCIFRNVSVHAEGFDLPSLFGKNFTGCSFYNTNVYANSLKYVGGASTTADGLNFIKA